MEFLNWIKSLLVDYGAINVIIMFVVIFLTNLIKRPIVNKADKFVDTAKKLTGLDVDKSVITSNIIYIPVGLAFVLYFIYTVISVKFNFYKIDWSQLVSNSLVYGMLSMSIYEIGKSKIKSYISKKNYNVAKAAIKESENKQIVETDDLLIPEVEEEVKENETTDDVKENEEIKEEIKEAE